jgi:hypothetical protein
MADPNKASFPHKPSPTPSHVIAKPAPEKPIARHNTSGQPVPQGQRPQTVPNEFIYTPYPKKK